MDIIVLTHLLEEERIPRKVFRDRKDPFQLPNPMFFSKYRFPKDVAMSIVDELRELLQRPTTKGKSFSPELIVLVGLNLLGSAKYQRASGQLDIHDINQGSVSRMFQEFLIAVLLKYKRKIMFPGGSTKQTETKNAFNKKFGFPNVIGVIDGIHISIKKPIVSDHTAYLNKEGVHSLNVQAVCDAYGNFTNLDVKCPGGTDDIKCYKNSTLYEFLHTDGYLEKAYLLGDSAYPLEPCLLTPIISASTKPEEKYNERHQSTRKVMVRALKVLKSRFRVLSKSSKQLGYPLEKCKQIIECCFILHNIAKERNVSEDYPENDEAEGKESVVVSERSRGAEGVRNSVVEFFKRQM